MARAMQNKDRSDLRTSQGSPLRRRKWETPCVITESVHITDGAPTVTNPDSICTSQCLIAS